MRQILILGIFALLTACAPGRSAAAPEAPAAPLVPGFDLGNEELSRFTASMQDRAAAQRINEQPAAFLGLMARVLAEPRELLLLADKQHALPADYIPPDLRRLTEYPLLLNRKDLRLRELIMPDLLAMDQAARADGIKLVYSSSYRSYEYQKNLFQRYVNEMGEAEASRVSARPGTSQHQLGTTVDFGSITDAFADTPEGNWLYIHAPEYGFTLSYPKGYEELTGYSWESWHYRFIGRPAAAVTVEFFDGMQHYFLYFMNQHRDFFEEHYNP